jgi:hypothetical protein
MHNDTYCMHAENTRSEMYTKNTRAEILMAERYIQKARIKNTHARAPLRG